MNFIQTTTPNSWVNLDHVAHTEPKGVDLLMLHMVNGESVLAHASDFDEARQCGGRVIPNTVEARVRVPSMLTRNGYVVESLPVIAWRQTSAHVWMPVVPSHEGYADTPLALQLGNAESVDVFENSFSTEYHGFHRSVEDWMKFEQAEIVRKAEEATP